MGFGSFNKKQPLSNLKTDTMDKGGNDATAWLVDSELANFLLMNSIAIKYMCMLGYTYLHGCKLFQTTKNSLPLSYKFISLILKCTGGGIFVPIFINAIPVPLANDAYPVCIFISFLLNEYVPILRDVLHESTLFHAFMIILYETMRASVVVGLTAKAGAVIPPSDFGSMPVFGPIFCGTIAGCGGIFLPLDRGLKPIEHSGLQQTMISAGLGATFYHLFVHTSLSDRVANAPKKAHVLVALLFIGFHLYALVDNVVSKHKVKVEQEKKTK